MSLCRAVLSLLPSEIADRLRRQHGEHLDETLTTIAALADDVGSKLIREVTGDEPEIDAQALAALTYLERREAFDLALARRALLPLARLRVFTSRAPFTGSLELPSVQAALADRLPCEVAASQRGALTWFAITRPGLPCAERIFANGAITTLRGRRVATDAVVVDVAARRIDIECDDHRVTRIYRRAFERMLTGRADALAEDAVDLTPLASLPRVRPDPAIVAWSITDIELRGRGPQRTTTHTASHDLACVANPRAILSATLRLDLSSGLRRRAVLAPPNEVSTDAPLDPAVRRFLHRSGLVRGGS